MKKFAAGKTYTTRSICDHDCVISVTIEKRTAKTVTATVRGEFEMIYGDRLAALFTEQTGFDTHL